MKMKYVIRTAMAMACAGQFFVSGSAIASSLDWGGLKIIPKIDMSLSKNDNILSSETNQKSSTITKISPSF
ncbi:MAG: hypothetical protein Q9M17_05085, partial [Mariprofundus sp.]|nr:hypothetical protein [Mariprofundus sp.]